MVSFMLLVTKMNTRVDVLFCLVFELGRDGLSDSLWKVVRGIEWRFLVEWTCADSESGKFDGGHGGGGRERYVEAAGRPGLFRAHASSGKLQQLH